MTRFQLGIPLTATLLMLLLCPSSGVAQAWDREGTHVILVAKKGGDFNSIQAAIDSITNATADYPYLVYVAPGVYEEQVTLKSYLAVEGAGRDLTRIVAKVGLTLPHKTWEVELRSLTVECLGSGEECSAVHLESGSLTAQDVRLVARGSDAAGLSIDDVSWVTLRDVVIGVGPTTGPSGCRGVGIRSLNDSMLPNDLYLDQVTIRLITPGSNCTKLGIFADLTSLVLHNSSVWVQRGQPDSSAIVLIESSAKLTNSEIAARRCAELSRSEMTVRHSVMGWVWDPVTGCPIEDFFNSSVRMSHSQLGGGVVGFDGRARCFSVHDADLNPLDENCQPIPPPGDDPRADFTYSVNGLTVQFQNQSTGTVPLSYSWAFGDSTTSTEANPTHVYATSGSYTVTLTVKNALGVDSIQRTVTVEH